MNGYLFDNLDNEEYMKEFAEHMDKSMEKHLEKMLDKGIPITYTAEKKDRYVMESPDGTKRFFKYVEGKKIFI